MLFNKTLFDGAAIEIGKLPIEAAATGSNGQIKIWDSLAWVTKPVKVWTGSTWAIKPLKFWDGATWQLTGY